MIEDLEAGLNGSPIDASITDDVALAEVENSDEAITAEAKASNDMVNDIKEEQWTESYKDTMRREVN